MKKIIIDEAEALLEHIKNPYKAKYYMKAAFEKYKEDDDLEALFLAVMYVANALNEWISFEDIKERFVVILNETGCEWFAIESAIMEFFDDLFEDAAYMALAEKRLEDIRAGLTRTVPLLDVIDKFENTHGSISTAQNWCSFMKMLRDENDLTKIPKRRI